MKFKEFYIKEDNNIDKILLLFNNDSEVVLYDWDKIAFGFSVDDVIDLNIEDIKIKYTGDLENAVYKIDNEHKFGKHFIDDYDKLPPIEVIYKNKNFYLDDGHHRYYYAKKNNINKVKAKVVRIMDNPIISLGYKSIDELINRFKFLKNQRG